MANASKFVHIQHSQVLDAKAFVRQRLLTDIVENRQTFAFPFWALEFSKTIDSISQAVRCLVEVSHFSIKELLMPLAPLRRVVSREIEVFRFHGEKPQQFIVHDALECGHSFTDFQWTILDLVNPYSETASKKRHRCRECAAIIARNERKPCQSVIVLSARRLA